MITLRGVLYLLAVVLLVLFAARVTMGRVQVVPLAGGLALLAYTLPDIAHLFGG